MYAICAKAVAHGPQNIKLVFTMLFQEREIFVQPKIQGVENIQVIQVIIPEIYYLVTLKAVCKIG